MSRRADSKTRHQLSAARKSVEISTCIDLMHPKGYARRMQRPIKHAHTALIMLALTLTACGGGASETSARPVDGFSGSPGGEGTSGEESARVTAPLRLPESASPTRYTLSLHIDPAQERFNGIAEIDVTLTEAMDRMWIHGENLTVTEATATPEGGAPVQVRWEQVDAEEGVARIIFPRVMEPGVVHLRLAYNAPFDETLEGLYRVHIGEDHYVFSQFESIAARKAFPCFDEPRFKVPFDVTVTIPNGQRAFANSRDIETTSVDGMTRVHFAATENLPTYLVAFAVGPLDVVEATIPPNAVRTTPLTLRGVAPRGRGPEMAYAMEHTPRIVAALEAWFGIAYPFDKLDIVAVPDFAAGAMENAGLVTFRDQLLLLSADAPAQQRRGFAFVMAHELAHQWFGNLVTMQWWDDLWLNEAFATWMETTIVASTFPEFHAETLELMTQLDAFDADSLTSARVIRQPIESSDDIANAFDSITYSKGASVLAMISNFMGPERFQAGIRSYLNAHARGNATTADLVSALTAAGNPNTAAVLESFTTQAGIPNVIFQSPICATGEGHTGATIAVRQSRYAPLGSAAVREATWAFPVCVTYADAGGVIQESCTFLTETEGQIETSTCPLWIAPNPRGESYFRFSMQPAQMAALQPLVRAAVGPSRRGRARTQWTEGARGGVASVRDLITMSDSARAGFTSGETSFESAMNVLAPMVASDDRFVATAPMELLAFAQDQLLSPAEEEAFLAYARRLYQPQFARLGWTARRGAPDDSETRSLRAAVLSFLALQARDPAVRAEANTRGRAFLGEGPGGDHHLHVEAVPADLLEVCLTVAAEEGDSEFFDRMLEELVQSQDGIVRGRLVTAMGHVDEDALRTRVLELSLDERLRQNERFRPLSGQFSDPEGRDTAWVWLQANYDRVRERFGAEYSGYVPFVTGGFCDRTKAREVRAFFEPRMADTQGGPRNLASAVETIALCAARADAQREGARAFFAATATSAPRTRR